MSVTIEKLLGVLEKSESVYRQLLPVIQKEKEAALFAQPEQLIRAAEEKEELLARLQQLDRNRQVLINQVSGECHIPVGEIKLSILAEAADTIHVTRMKRVSTSLSELVPVIKKANEENRAIIQHCLSIVQGTLGFFRHWVMPNDVYGASGQMSVHQNGGNLISGAI